MTLAAAWAEKRRVAGVVAPAPVLPPEPPKAPSREKPATAPAMSADEERALIRRYQGGDRSAGEALLAAHERFILGAAKGDPDATQEARLALLDAARRFDLSRPNRLASYGWVFVMGAAIRALRSRQMVRGATTVGLDEAIPGTDDLTIGDTLRGFGATPEDLVLESCR